MIAQALAWRGGRIAVVRGLRELNTQQHRRKRASIGSHTKPPNKNAPPIAHLDREDVQRDRRRPGRAVGDAPGPGRGGERLAQERAQRRLETDQGSAHANQIDHAVCQGRGDDAGQTDLLEA